MADYQELKDLLAGIRRNKDEPNMSEEIMSAETAQINDEAKSPYQETQMERVEDVMQQEVAKTIPGQVAAGRQIASTPSNPATQETVQKIADTPKKPSQLELMQQQMDQLKTQGKADLTAAKESDRNKMLLANAIKALGTLGQAELQRSSGVKGGIEQFKAVDGPNTAAEVKADQKASLANLQAKLAALTGREQTLADKADDRAFQKELLGDKLASQEKVAAAKASKETKKPSKLEEKRQVNIANRYDELQEQVPNIQANIQEAKALAQYIEDDQLDTGPGSKLAGDVGSFFGTEESALKQRLDSLAERAARAQLKANGEVRPTDADVEGMKKAMFNMGNTEKANIKKLQDFIKLQESSLKEYNQMKEVVDKGEGLEDFKLAPTYTPEPEVNEVRKRDPKSGKIAVFDGKTKEFLRYEE